jgi:hypothetical protein
MREKSSLNFKKSFLLLFTKELIRHSVTKDIFKLQNIIEKEQSKRVLEKKEIPKREVISPLKTEFNLEQQKAVPVTRRFTRPITKPPLFIPEPKLPPHLQYLKPIPAPAVEIDLLNLNPLIKDPAVRVIECNPDERAIVTGTMGTKPTDIILNKEDIDTIINRFSEISKIPVSEGIYRVIAGNLILSAIISEVIGSRFIIRKMATFPIPGQALVKR